MKHLLLLLFSIFGYALFGQNVGINKSNPTEVLDVNGNIRYDSLKQSNNLTIPILRAYGTIGLDNNSDYVILDPGSGNWTVTHVDETLTCGEGGSTQVLEFDHALVTISNETLDSTKTLLEMNLLGLGITTQQAFATSDGKAKFYSIFNGISCYSTIKQAFNFKIESW